MFMTGLRNAVGVWVDPGDRPCLGHQHGSRLAGQRPAARDALRGGRRRRCRLAEMPRGDLVDPEFGGEGACDGSPIPAVTFGAHIAPLALLAGRATCHRLHGSWNRSTRSGTRSGGCRGWRAAGEPEPFATGFLPEGAQDALGRPAGLAVGADGALSFPMTRAAPSIGSRAGSVPTASAGVPSGGRDREGPRYVERAVDDNQSRTCSSRWSGPRRKGHPIRRDGGANPGARGHVTITVSESHASLRPSPTAKRPSSRLASTAEGLLARCNCSIGYSGHLCPHSFATAFVTWDRG